ncbi:FMN-binding protein [Flagellimonas sp. 389]|uniref:FMN-binding protein n=1 Tax=Flagellimonas sp. 389 TaxID=2835862 RepID=UPI001BD337C7|nr:FMN-binding protein [uncultured Allomuricauda sp.]MBS9461896.1 FMN-binding protein [Flagellimonas sp. 389]
MKLESNSKLIVMAMFCMAFLFLGFSPKKISPRLQEKLNNAVQSTFEVEGFELQWIQVEEAINAKTKVELGHENLFKVEKSGKLIGYAYLGEAPSMKNIFDYVVLFNPDLSIKKSKVLIYREDYGRQIGSQRWLKQFIGKKSGDTIIYGEDVDAISGATISAKSMTVAVNAVLSSVEVLKKSKIL